MSAPRQVWVISDGKPGHFNQSRGILLALSRLGPVEEAWIDVRLRSGLWRRPLTALLNATRAPLPATLLSLCCVHDALPAARPDLIVAAGGRAVFAAILLARRFGVPLVFSGSLRGLAARHFAAALTLERQVDDPANLVLAFPPMPVDRDVLARRGAALRARLAPAGQPLWAVLLGGDGAGFRYEAADWRALATGLSRQAHTAGARLLVTTSRRTGAAAEAELRAAFDAGVLADAVWYAESPRPVMADFLGAASCVFCTADSMSMLMEAIVAGRPVYALAPAAASPDARYRAVLDREHAAGHLRPLPAAALATHALRDDDFRCVTEDPLATLAAQLSVRLAGAGRTPPSPT